jgi:hypothetical protein
MLNDETLVPPRKLTAGAPVDRNLRFCDHNPVVSVADHALRIAGILCIGLRSP